MNSFNAYDYKLFTQIVGLNQHTLMLTMRTFLEKEYSADKVLMTRDFIFARGTIPIMVVAHMDTVFPNPPTDIFYDREKSTMWSPQGLGADDRAGIFLIIKLVRAGYRPYILFTTDEEKGGLGAMGFTMMFPKAPEDVKIKYIIQLDRCGTDDCVFYYCDNPEFTKYVESFGFIEALGSFSDISEICPAWGVAGVNLSVGYFNEHNPIERLNTHALLKTYSRVCDMLKASKDAPAFEYRESKNPYKYSYTWDPGESWYSDVKIPCNHCGIVLPEFELFPVKMKDGGTTWYCPDCIATQVPNVDWCEYCGEAFETDMEASKLNLHLCKDCRKIMVRGSSACTTISANKLKM